MQLYISKYPALSSWMKLPLHRLKALFYIIEGSLSVCLSGSCYFSSERSIQMKPLYWCLLCTRSPVCCIYAAVAVNCAPFTWTIEHKKLIMRITIPFSCCCPYCICNYKGICKLASLFDPHLTDYYHWFSFGLIIIKVYVILMMRHSLCN